jgi:hypothetical protein
MQDTPAWYHSAHFSGNTIAVVTAVIGILVSLCMCVQSQRKRALERCGRKIEDAVLVALNTGTPHPNFNFPTSLALPMPILSHPLSTIYVQPPINPHISDASSSMSRPHSFTNLTSISAASPRPSIMKIFDLALQSKHV